MAKIDTEGGPEILEIIRDGHYLALTTPDMKVFVLRNADSTYPACIEYAYGSSVRQDRTEQLDSLAQWIDNLIGGRPVAGYGMRATVPEMVTTTGYLGTVDMIESVRRSPMTMEDRQRHIDKLQRTRPENQTYYTLGGPRDNIIWKNDTGTPLCNGITVNFRHISEPSGEESNLQYRVKGATLEFIGSKPRRKK